MNALRVKLPFISPPKFQETEKTRIAGILYACAISVFFGIFSLLLYRVVIGQFHLIPPMAVVSALLCVSIILLRRGLTVWSASLLSWSLQAFFFYLIIYNDGIHDTAVLAFPGIFVISSLVLRRRYFYFFAGVALTVMVAVGIGQSTGFIRTSYLGTTSAADIIDVVVILGITAFTVMILSENLLRSLSRATANEEILRAQASQLIESEKSYRNLFEGANDAILILKGDLFVQCNEIAVGMFGCSSRNDIVGHAPWEFSPPLQPDGKDSKAKANELLDAARNMSRQRFTWRHRRMDGSVFDAEISLNSVAAKDGALLQAIVRDVSERVIAEESLRDSEQRFSILASAAFEGIVVSENGKILDINEQLAGMLGYKRSEMVNLTVDTFVAPESIELVMQHIRSGSEEPYEHLSLRKDGSRFPVEIRAKSLPLRGRLVRVTAVRDITERKRIDGEMLGKSIRIQRQHAAVIELATHECLALGDVDGLARRATELISEIVNVARVSIWLIEDDGAKLACHDLYEIASRRHSSGEFLKTAECPVYFRTLRDEFYVAAADAQNDPRTSEFRDSYLAPLGISSMLDSALRLSGKLVGAVCLEHIGECRNWTDDEIAFVKQVADRVSETLINRERKRDGERIEEQARLLDVARDAIIVRDMNDQLVYMNRAAQELYGWSFEECRKMASVELMADDDRDRFLHLKEEFILKGEWEGEIHQKTRDGRVMIIQTHWTLVRDRQGMPAARLVINRDITEQRRLELQFRRAQRLESLGTLAGGIAHDLNNVLAPIMMSIGMLEARITDPAMLKLISTLDANVQRGSDIIRQVLMFARGSEKDFAPQQLRYIIREITTIVKETFPRDIQLKTDIAPNLGFVRGDATQLHQVLMNLCVNARDAMPDGGLLSVSAMNVDLNGTDVKMKPGSTPGPHVLLAVSDTGMGIPREIQDRIFGPFFTTKEIGKGTGLGLSTVYAIVKDHKGWIDLYSEPGVGTMFRIYLPVIPHEEIAGTTVHGVGVPSGNGELILVVDDERAILEISRETLEGRGYRVVTAANGAEAVERFRSSPRGAISLVITDVNMPIMNGLAVVEALRATDPTVKVIIASGLVADLEPIKRKGLEIQGYLMKPFTSQRLLASIRDILTDKQ
jgi:PAS domain S-box-containing protein